MTPILRLACLFCLVSTLGVAGNLSGWLVDSKCYARLWNFRGTTEASWDVNSAIRYCSPEKRTHSFAVIRQDDGSPFSFDPAGNEKAIDLKLSASDESLYLVNVTGASIRNSVNVATMSVIKRAHRDGKGAPGL